MDKVENKEDWTGRSERICIFGFPDNVLVRRTELGEYANNESWQMRRHSEQPHKIKKFIEKLNAR